MAPERALAAGSSPGQGLQSRAGRVESSVTCGNSLIVNASTYLPKTRKGEVACACLSFCRCPRFYLKRASI